MSATEAQEAEAREFLDKARDRLLVEWATGKAAAHFKQPSTGYIPPVEIAKWAKANGLMEHLPEPYQNLA